MLKAVSKRYFNTTCRIVSFKPSDVRLESHNGTPNKRESVHNMWGSPTLSEVTCLKANGTFFDMGNPKSEMLGAGRGDAFINVAYDGKTFYIEPNIPMGLKEVSSSYPLVRFGQRERTNENLLQAILTHNPRMIMGQKPNGEMVFIAAEGRRFGEEGLTSEEERTVCISEGLWTAVNNDGGGSTFLFTEDKVLNKAYDGRSLGYIWVGYRKWTLNELPDLKRHSKGMWVNLLQRMLALLDLNLAMKLGTLDGDFGPKTEEAVRAHQLRYGLKVDGRVGHQTWGSLCLIHKIR